MILWVAGILVLLYSYKKEQFTKIAQIILALGW
jgi:hypothetical protein